MNVTQFVIDPSVITAEEAESYIAVYRERLHPRRIQAWFDQCARIRKHSSYVAPADVFRPAEVSARIRGQAPDRPRTR